MQRLGGSSCKLAGDLATRTRTQGPGKRNKLLAQQEQSPWRSKSTPPGPRRLHPVGALARTHRNHENKTQSRREPLQDRLSTKPQGECSHSPRGLGATVGYHKKGYPKQEPKKFLRPCKYRSQETTTRPRPIPRFAQGPCRKASNEVPSLRLARGPAPQGLGRGTDSPPRPRPRSKGLG